MESINYLRSFRLNVNGGRGIAMFDLFSAFFGAFLLDKYFDLSKKLSVNYKLYYLLVIPIGIISHILFKQDTFFTKSK